MQKSCYSGGGAVMAQKQMKRLAVFSYTHKHTVHIRCVRYIIYIHTPHTYNLGSRGKIDENFT